MRVSDPFDTVDVGKRQAALFIVAFALVIVALAMVFPSQIALIAMGLSLILFITLHEAGHFFAARRSGMKATEFFVGFGPRLWSFKRGETEYGIKAIVLGGYCKIIGMNNLEEIDPEDEERAYRSKGWRAKVFVAGAGPATHFAIALVLTFILLWGAGDLAKSTPTLTLKEVSAGAAAAGLVKGDEVIEVNGKPVGSWKDVAPLIKGPEANPAEVGDTIMITVRRDGLAITRAVELQAAEGETVPAGEKPRPVAGIRSKLYTPPLTPVEAARMAPGEVLSLTGEAAKGFGSMFSPSGVSNYFKILSGDDGKEVKQDQRFLSPVGFVQVSNDALDAGWIFALRLLIAINVFIGLFNLLPLLPFDGGLIAVASYESVMSKIKGRRVEADITKLLPITAAVFAVLMFIGITSLWLDIANPIKTPF